MDGSALAGTESESTSPPAPSLSPQNEPAQISVRTLMLSIGVLFAAGVLGFASVFFYQYLKPKYGGLVVKTTPAGAAIRIDGRQRGPSPITLSDLRSGVHQLQATKEGYKDMVQQVEVMPYATENLHWTLEPLVAHLTNEQLADIESLRKKLDSARKENILLPPPEDYNVLYFVNRILAIDPADTSAADARNALVDTIRGKADLAYAREDWLEAEKQYRNLAMIFPDDVSISERLVDIASKIDASVKDRDKQIADWTERAEAAMKAGSLVPPEKENALEAIQKILRLDRKNSYARGAMARVKEMLQTRGDIKVSNSDWQGARNDFRIVLQFFPEDSYSKSRMSLVEGKLAEAAQVEQQHLQQLQREQQEEQQSRQKIAALHQSAINAFRAGSYQKALSEWHEYLKYEPNSDEAYYYIGAVYQEEKQLDTAILNLERSLSINPNNASAHLNLGILYDRHRNNLTLALDHLKKAGELGGAEKYGPERIQAMIQDLQDRIQLTALRKTPFLVEHKHVFSSCRGNLTVSEEGIEYKTTETEHSFYETFAGLRSLSISGDDITLRTSDNKKYNFQLLHDGDAARFRLLTAPHLQVTD